MIRRSDWSRRRERADTRRFDLLTWLWVGVPSIVVAVLVVVTEAGA